MHRFLTMLAMLSLTACSTIDLQDRLPVTFEPRGLTLAARLCAQGMSVAEREDLVDSVETRFESKPSDRSRFDLAIVHATSNDPKNISAALDLLNRIDASALSRRDRTFYQWLMEGLAARQALLDQHEALKQELAATDAALSRAEMKIRTLTQIEQTIGPERGRPKETDDHAN